MKLIPVIILAVLTLVTGLYLMQDIPDCQFFFSPDQSTSIKLCDDARTSYERVGGNNLSCNYFNLSNSPRSLWEICDE